MADSGYPVDDAGFTLVPIELGTGSAAWECFAATAPHARLIMGPQGGYHTLGRVRFTGFAPDVTLRFRVVDTGSGTVFNDATDALRRRERQGLTRVGDAWESSSAELVIFTQIRSPAEAIGRTVRWEVTIEETGTGRVARASRVLIIDP
jgi:hypothetical protein